MTTIRETQTARLAEIQETLVKYKRARDGILNGAQATSIGTRTITRADLDTVEKYIERLEDKELKLISILNNSKIPIRGQRILIRDS